MRTILDQDVWPVVYDNAMIKKKKARLSPANNNTLTPRLTHFIHSEEAASLPVDVQAYRWYARDTRSNSCPVARQERVRPGLAPEHPSARAAGTKGVFALQVNTPEAL